MSAYAAALGAWNVVVNRMLSETHYVQANLGVAAGSLAWARVAGATSGDLGTSPAAAAEVVRWSGLAAIATAMGAVVASRMPLLSHLFDDARARPDDVAYQALVRIPLGTVILEEMAFRGVLPWMSAGPDRHRPSLRSAALFGLWHVLPTLRTLDINAVGGRRTRVSAVVGAVAVTSMAGLALEWIRLRKQSLLPAVLVHWSANATGYLIAARRRAR